MAPQVPPRRTRDHLCTPALEKENEAPQNFRPGKPRGILKHSVTAPHASPNCKNEDCRTITLTLSELQNKTQVVQASMREAKPEISPAKAHVTASAPDELSEISVSPWIARREKRLEEVRKIGRFLTARLESVGPHESSKLTQSTLRNESAPKSPTNDAHVLMPNLLESTVNEMVQLASAPLKMNFPVTGPRQGIGKEMKVKNNTLFAPDFDICSLLLAAKQNAGSAGISAVADVLKEAGMLSDERSERRASTINPALLECVSDHTRDTDWVVASHAIESTWTKPETKAGEVGHDPQYEDCDRNWETPSHTNKDSSLPVGEASNECACLACICTFMSNSPQHHKNLLPEEAINIPDIGLKFSVLFSWRCAIRENTVKQARKRKTIIAMKLARRRLPALASIFVLWRDWVDETSYIRLSSKIAENLEQCWSSRLSPFPVHWSEQKWENEGRVAIEESRHQKPAASTHMNVGMDGPGDISGHSAETWGLSPSPSIPLPPSPTPCTRSSNKEVLSSDCSLSSVIRAQSQFLQRLEDVASALQIGEVGKSCEDTTTLFEPNDAIVTGAKTQSNQHMSDLRVSGWVDGLLLSPEEDREQRRATCMGFRDKVQRPCIPAVTPTLARAPSNLRAEQVKVHDARSSTSRQGKVAGSILPPVTPALARLQFLGEKHAARDRRTARLQALAISSPVGEDEGQRETLRPSGRKGPSRGSTVAKGDGHKHDQMLNSHQFQPVAHNYPGFFQQVRELQLRKLLTEQEGRELCARALNGDQGLAHMYKQRKRLHLLQGVHGTCHLDERGEERERQDLPARKREGRVDRTGSQSQGPNDLHMPEKDWKVFAENLKRMLK